MKPKEIIELEKYLDFELTETKNSDYISNYLETKLYLLNDAQEVIGLNLYGCELKDISFLQNLTNLQTLYLTNNEVSNYYFLQGLPNLTSLYLSDNKISDVYFLKYLKNLKILHLRGN